MFRPRCDHRWEEMRRHSQPPANSFKFGGGAWINQYNDLVYGWTMVELRCGECGDLKTRKLRYTGGAS